MLWRGKYQNTCYFSSQEKFKTAKSMAAQKLCSTAECQEIFPPKFSYTCSIFWPFFFCGVFGRARHYLDWFVQHMCVVFISCFVVLRWVLLCCDCCVVLHCTVVVIHYVVLRSVVLCLFCCVALRSIVLLLCCVCWVGLHCDPLRCVALHCAVLHCWQQQLQAFYYQIEKKS